MTLSVLLAEIKPRRSDLFCKRLVITMVSPPFTINGSDAFSTFTYVFSIIANLSTLFQIRQYVLYPEAAESISLLAWGMYWTSSFFWFLYAAQNTEMDWGLWLSSLFGTALYLTVFLMGLRATFQNKNALVIAIEAYRDKAQQGVKEAGEALFRRFRNP